jgi:hypothetical protein
LYLPVAIGDRLDLSVDYFVRLFGPAIVFVPKDMEFPLSWLENLENANRENRTSRVRPSTHPLLENSNEKAVDK